MRKMMIRRVFIVLMALAPSLALATTLSGATLWHTLHRALYVSTGPSHPRRIIYVFFDPNCMYCHAFWEVAHSVQAEIGLRIRWLPVGRLKPSSLPKAAAIVLSRHPGRAFTYDETHFDTATETGGIPGVRSAPSGVVHGIQANWKLMSVVLGATGTPTIVYPYHGRIVVQKGLPDSQAAIGRILTGD